MRRRRYRSRAVRCGRRAAPANDPAAASLRQSPVWCQQQSVLLRRHFKGADRAYGLTSTGAIGGGLRSDTIETSWRVAQQSLRLPPRQSAPALLRGRGAVRCHLLDSLGYIGRDLLTCREGSTASRPAMATLNPLFAPSLATYFGGKKSSDGRISCMRRCSRLR